MKILLRESTRDNMLLPYLEKMQANGYTGNLGRFKTDLLQHLAADGGLHNLSLRSNFYLAGAARYYFNGDLTVDGNVGMLNGQPDNFNEDICKRLNALVNILRNAYIDNVGTAFEQPEDFGTLKISALLKKYNHKINVELGIEDNKRKKEAKVDNLDRTPEVGKGYSFDIIYTFPMGNKYEKPTMPGAWCVTYGENHYNSYTRHTNPPSHLVVFRQDGWESINRENGMDKSKWVTDNYNGGRDPRPHDPYANSLIAFFQSNESYMPADWYGYPLITSRYNHGTGIPGGLEADRAYSFEEFKQITGVNDAELQRIYTIWKKDVSQYKVKTSGPKISAEEKAERLEFLRMLKYAQIRANGGERLDTTINGLEIVETLFGKEGNINKNISTCKVGNNYFLIDRGQIVFDAICYNCSKNPFITHVANDDTKRLFDNAVIINPEDSVYMVYNFRFHKIVDAEGLSKFCAASIRTDRSEGDNIPTAVLFRQRGNRSVLFSSRTGLPIKLPNGHCIFEYCKYEGSTWGVTNDDYYITKGSILFIMYDSSARDAYIFNPDTEKFTPFNKDNWEDINEIKYIGIRRWWMGNGREKSRFDELSIEYKESEWGPKKSRNFLFDSNTGEQMNIFPGDAPYASTMVVGQFGDYLMLSYSSKDLRALGIPRVNNKPFVMWNYVDKHWLIDRETRKPMQFDNGIYEMKYPDMNLILVIDRNNYWHGESPTPPYLLELESQIKYPIRIPEGYYVKPWDLYITEEWFSMEIQKRGGGYGEDATRAIEENLRNRGYAIKGRTAFFKYEDVMIGRITSPEEIDVDAAYAMVHPYRNMNESVIKITKDDIKEMVISACRLILESRM